MNLLSISFLSTYANVLFAFIVSIVFLFILDPDNANCSMFDYISAAQYATFVLLPFVLWTCFSNGTLRRVGACWSRMTSKGDSNLGDGLIGPFKNNSEENSMVSQVFNLFFDRWILVASVDVLFVFIVKFGALNPDDTTGSSDLVSTFFQVWASSMMFIETLDLFRGRHPGLTDRFILSFAPQVAIIWAAAIATIILVFLFGFGAYKTSSGRGFVIFTLALRFAIHVYQLVSFTALITVITKFSSELLEAVVTSSSMAQAAEDRLDFPFRVNSDCSQRRSGLAENMSNASYENNNADATNVMSFSSSVPESVSLKGPRSDYSQVYKECDKIADVLKMLVTLIFINAIFDVTTFITAITVNFTGNMIVSQTLKLSMFLLPWIYLAGYRLSPSNCAVTNARKGCVLFLVSTAYVITTIIGGYLGCSFLSANTFFGVRGKQFLLYLAKSTALPTTVSIAMVALTSPGVRGWQTLPWYCAYFLVPIVWMPPFVMQELHEASGANFMLLGFVHTVAWVIMVCIGMFDLLQLGVMFATVTGLVMLAFGVKLLWPPGQSIPFATPESSQLYKRFDAFLRDSKYGSYHIYLAFFTICLFIVHGILKIKFSFAWYFLFAIFAVMMMVASNPTKRYYWRQAIHVSTGSSRDRFEIISKKSTPIRGKGLVAVELMLNLPSNVNLETLQGCGDVITIQNLTSEKSSALLSSIYRTVETAHYFSVVSIELIPSPEGADKLPTAKVLLMIQKTSRPDGASTSLVEDKDSDKMAHKVQVLGFMKSNSLEALYSPCLIAFGYESGSAAFCSMMKERMKMRLVVETSAKRVKLSELTDLCVIWCQFMKKPRGRAVKASDIADALKELSAMQEFLYSNSGGRGVKLLFICTGVPSEWTPDPECITHRMVMLETEVATTLNCTFNSSKDTNDPNARSSWFSPPLSMVSGEYNPDNPNHADNPAIRPSHSRLSSTNGVFRGSILNFGDTWGRTSSITSDEVRSSAVNNRKSSSSKSAKRFSLGGLRAIQEDENKSTSDGVELNSESGVNAPTVTPFSGSVDNAKGPPPSALKKVPSKPDIESGLAGGHAPVEYKDEYRRDIRRSSLFSVPHHFLPSQSAKQRSPIETLVNIQTKEESWVPLRHALGSNWKTFCNTLDYRIGSAVHWLNHPGGPDYTSLFITEHQSDVPILRDFKYSEVYDEVNSQIIEHQLRYCKNPAHYIAGQTGADRDPVNSAPLACSVLYSGDYATPKRENLRCTVERIQERENLKSEPATLYFIPDA